MFLIRSRFLISLQVKDLPSRLYIATATRVSIAKRSAPVPIMELDWEISKVRVTHGTPTVDRRNATPPSPRKSRHDCHSGMGSRFESTKIPSNRILADLRVLAGASFKGFARGGTGDSSVLSYGE